MTISFDNVNGDRAKLVATRDGADLLLEIRVRDGVGEAVVASARMTDTTMADQLERRAPLSYLSKEGDPIVHEREVRAIAHTLGRSDMPLHEMDVEVARLVAIESMLAACIADVAGGTLTVDAAWARLRDFKTTARPR